MQRIDEYRRYAKIHRKIQIESVKKIIERNKFLKNRPENLISGKENFYEIYVYYDVTSGYRDTSRKICQTAASWTLVTLVKN